jgi:predicted HD superfamily hydrolase involved in NAD metabolism
LNQNYEKYKSFLKTTLTQERFEHSLLVMETAEELSGRFGLDAELVKVAALLHDAAKDLSNDKILSLAKAYGWEIDPVEEAHGKLLHAPASAQLVKEQFDINDTQILNAIAYHTVGRPAMTEIDKIIYLADHIEPTRDYPGVEKVRALAKTNLDEAIVACIDSMLTFLIQYGKPVCFKTLETRNYYLTGKT